MGPFIVCRSLRFSDYPVFPLWVLSLCLWALSYAYRPFSFYACGPFVYAYGPFLFYCFYVLLCAVLTFSLMICYPLLCRNTACHLVVIPNSFNRTKPNSTICNHHITIICRNLAISNTNSYILTGLAVKGPTSTFLGPNQIT